MSWRGATPVDVAVFSCIQVPVTITNLSTEGSYFFVAFHPRKCWMKQRVRGDLFFRDTIQRWLCNNKEKQRKLKSSQGEKYTIVYFDWACVLEWSTCIKTLANLVVMFWHYGYLFTHKRSLQRREKIHVFIRCNDTIQAHLCGRETH